MRFFVFLLSTSAILSAAAHWETRHYETTDNGFMDAAAPDSLVGVLCGVRDNVGVIIYKTTDGGEIWQETHPWTINQAMFCFALQFPNQNTGYMTAMGILSNIFPCGALYKTTDGGNTWILNYGLTFSFLNIYWDDVFFVDLNNGWLAGPNSDIRWTTNAGANWTTQTAPVSASLKSIYFINPNEGWIVGGDYDTLTGQGTNGVILHTTNGGANWVTQLSDAPLQLWGVHFIDALNGWVCGYKDTLSPGVFLHTTDGGDNWTEIMAPSVALGAYGLYAIDFPDPLIGFATGAGNRSGWSGSYFGTFLKTTNGGNTWSVDTVIYENDPWGLSPLGMDMYSTRWGYAGGARLSAFRYGEVGVHVSEHEENKELDAGLPLVIPDARGFKISFSPGMAYLKVSVYDVLGRKIIESVPTGSVMSIKVPSAGNYFIIFRTDDDGRYTRKVSVW